MASAVERTEVSYVLYGFGNDLDWRQTCFLEPLPPSRYCAYCGRVCATMMLLPCCHIVCASCYNQCIKRNYACALDAQRFRLHDAAAMVYTVHDLASKHIRCWNAGRGCDILGPSFQILEHYRKDCQYHLISCLRCGKVVSHGDVVAHLAQGCSPDTSMRHLPLQTKQALPAGAKETERQLEGQNSADSRVPGAAEQDLFPPDNQRADLEGRVVSSEPLEVAFEPCNQEPRISQTLQPGKATDRDEPSSSRRGTPSPTDDSCKPPVVASGEYQQLPSTAHPESVKNKLSATSGKDVLVAIKKSCAYLENVMREGLESVCSQTKPSVTTTQEGSSSISASAVVDNAQQGSTQCPDTAATEADGTLPVLQWQGSSRSMVSVVTSEAATVPGDLASSDAEKQTTTAQESGNVEKERKCDPLQGQPAMTDSVAPSHDEVEGDFNPQVSAGGDGGQATTSDVSNPTTLTPTSVNPSDDALLFLLSGYIKPVNRFLCTIFKGINDVYDALEEFEPEDLTLVLKDCEELRASMREECLGWGAIRDQIQQEVAKVFDAIRGQVHIMSGEDLFEDPVGKKIDGLMNMGKHILRERIRDSVPVQWHLDRWSELKARAVATGTAADYYSGIRTTFFGYFIVPGLLLEKTASKLMLRFSFYVRKGDFDDFLQWPIEKEFTLSILHPTDKEKVRRLVVDTRMGLTERYARPGNETREPVSSTKSLKANYIDANGFVEGDKLLLQFEVK